MVVTFVCTVCTAAGVELVSWDSCAAVFVPDKVLLCVTAAACVGPADSLVVRGGSANGVNWDAVKDEAA